MEETAEMMNLFWKATKIGDKGTERMDAFIKRNCELCDVVMENHRGENVLIVTHAANARAIDYYFIGKPKNYDFNKRVIAIGELILMDDNPIEQINI